MSIPSSEEKQSGSPHNDVSFVQVYLAQDQESERLFALKKIRCPLGSDSVKTALKEVEGKINSITLSLSPFFRVCMYTELYYGRVCF